MGTIKTRHLSADGQIPLSRNMTRQGWEALAKAAQALLDVARVALGETVSTPVGLSPAHPSSSASVGETVNDFLVAKARAGRSDRYLRALKNSLSKFVRGRSRQPLDAVTTEQIEMWLAESDWAPRTQKGYLLDVRTMYNFAVRRGYCAGNPANAVECAQPGASLIGIHTPEQVRVVLHIARRMDLHTMRCLAVRYFAGLRASEAEMLEETEIKLEQGVIEVSAAKSKTRRRRLVTIEPVLREWLALGGILPLRDVSRRMRELTRAVRSEGIPWPNNAPRHSYCSYHIAWYENAGKTALSAGHSEQMLFQHYRALVTKAEAEKFWALSPDPVTKALVTPQADKPALGDGEQRHPVTLPA